jgi:hypothetical protein
LLIALDRQIFSGRIISQCFETTQLLALFPMVCALHGSKPVIVECAMSVSISVANVPLSSLSALPGSQSSTSLTTKSAQSAAQQFQEYASMTPAQRLQAQMLAKLSLTEDQFKAMSPADQQTVEDKIRDMIKQQLSDSNDNRTGMITDKTA